MYFISFNFHISFRICVPETSITSFCSKSQSIGIFYQFNQLLLCLCLRWLLDLSLVVYYNTRTGDPTKTKTGKIDVWLIYHVANKCNQITQWLNDFYISMMTWYLWPLRHGRSCRRPHFSRGGIGDNHEAYCRRPTLSSRQSFKLLIYYIKTYISAMHTYRIGDRLFMMTSSNGNIFRVTGHLCGEITGPRWILHTKASDAELWCFLWSASE